MLTGNCHCGAVTWRFIADPGSVTACNCTVCARAGTLWIYGIEGEEVHVSGPTSAYIRKDGGALEFHHCPTCGNTISWRFASPETGHRMAVNLRLADDPQAIMHLPIDHFDGHDTFADLPDDGTRVKDIWF